MKKRIISLILAVSVIISCVPVVAAETTGKTGSTYYTAERIATARENILNYTWAAAEQASAVKNADTQIKKFDTIYSLITSNSVPRSYLVGLKNDPYYKYCRWCGENIAGKYGASHGGKAYDVDVHANPWKAQCRDCERLFPSNDFESFYELGLAKDGTFDRMRALEAHRAMLLENGAPLPETLEGADGSDAWYAYYGYGNPAGYLYNKEYPELYTVGETLNGIDPFYYNADLDGDGTADHDEVEIDGIMWGVDDSMGYDTRRINANGVPEVHTWVSYINYTSLVQARYAINCLSYAYVYTGDAKYGSYGAILLDRIADFYPDWKISDDTTGYYSYWQTRYDVADGKAVFATSGGGGPDGKIWGRITDCDYTRQFLLAADAFYPVLDDADFQTQLTEKTGKTDVEPETIWQNWAENLIKEAFEACKTADLWGNYGMQQEVVAIAALVLDSEPESGEMIEWLFQSGGYETDENGESWCTGGGLSTDIIDRVDRDGMGDEGSPTYNAGWCADLLNCAEALALYGADAEYNLYKNPKFAKMFTSCIPLTTVDTHVAAIGDSTAPAALAYADTLDTLKAGFEQYKDTAYIGNALAEYIYRRNGYTVEGLNYDIFTENPEALGNEILSRIDDDLQPPSEMMTGYGFSILRDGERDTSAESRSNMRDFWLTFGYSTASHAHRDKLNLGIEAFGLNMAPDLGYPEVTGKDPNRYQWVRPTISHNTVTVNEKSQLLGGVATPLHFDDSGEVKLMDIDASSAYAETDIYRRTVVMIDAGDGVSYGVDFFRVKGGTNHIYSFHSQSEEIGDTEGLTLTAQSGGTYAGENVAWGADPSGETDESNMTYPAGYTWMKNVRRASDVGNFAVDFNVTDYNGALPEAERENLHLRLTMLNDFTMNEVALTSGDIANKSNTGNLPETFEYVLARREGADLDSLFTTVYEPYRNDRYLSDMSEVTVTPAVGDEGKLGTDDTAKAVKVVHADGRTDYVIYATNNSVLYTVTDGDRSFKFRGFVGVYSVDGKGKDLYTYVNDGDVIGKYEGSEKAYTGTVSSFTEELSLENSITITTNDDIDIDSLAGKYVYVDNDDVQNGVYKIESATKNENSVELDIGAVSLIRSTGYTYNIAKGQSVTIPLSTAVEVPEFETVNSEIFGTQNGFIKNVGETNSLWLFSGINSLDYARAGFRVTLDGKTTNLTTTNVYSKVTANSEDISPTEFGGNSAYIFAREFNLTNYEKDKPIFFQPFAIDFTGTYYYGKPTVITQINETGAGEQ